jgi:hypothetical protein
MSNFPTLWEWFRLVVKSHIPAIIVLASPIPVRKQKLELHIRLDKHTL